MKEITSPLVPRAIGPYKQAYQCNGFLFTSGQLPICPVDNHIPDDFAQQVHQVCQNIKAILESGNSSLEKVIKTTCFLQNMEDFPLFNEIYALYFTAHPARTCVAVKTLPKNVLVEIEAIAFVEE